VLGDNVAIGVSACMTPKLQAFEHFANENHKLGNEPKLTQPSREVPLKISRRVSLSVEMNDASA